MSDCSHLLASHVVSWYFAWLVGFLLPLSVSVLLLMAWVVLVVLVVLEVLVLHIN